jgi:hypothetical protein
MRDLLYFDDAGLEEMISTCEIGLHVRKLKVAAAELNTRRQESGEHV